MKQRTKVIASAALSIALCASMITGATFALFTDEAETNIAVTAGKVSVDAIIDTDSLKLYSMGEEQQEKNSDGNKLFANKGYAAIENGGATLRLVNVTPGDKAEYDINITNNSNVDVKYRVVMKAEGALADALIAKANDQTITTTSAATDWTDIKKEATILVSVELPMAVGDKNQGTKDGVDEAPTNVTIVIEAVQANGADMTVSTAEQFRAALSVGGDIALETDVDLNVNSATGTVITKNANIDFNGHAIDYDTKYVSGLNGTQISALTIDEGANVTMTNGHMAGVTSEYGVYVKNGTLTIQGGTYHANTSVVQVANGTLNIEGGTFSVAADNKSYVINCLDACWKDGSAKINITGGIFIGFDPANNAAEGTNTNFVADGYHSVQMDNDTWVVVPTSVTTVKLVDQANELSGALSENDYVILSADVDLSATSVSISADEKATLDLNGHTINAIQLDQTTYGTFNIAEGAELTVKGEGNVTLKTNVTTGISACIFQNDGVLNIYGGNYEANQATSVAGLGAVIAVIDNCPYANDATVNIYGGTFAVTGLGAINIIRNWPIQKNTATTTLNIYGGTFKANPTVTTTYLWNKNDSNEAEDGNKLASRMNFYGGVFENGVVYEDYQGRADVYIADGVIINGYTGNN